MVAPGHDHRRRAHDRSRLRMGQRPRGSREQLFVDLGSRDRTSPRSRTAPERRWTARSASCAARAGSSSSERIAPANAAGSRGCDEESGPARRDELVGAADPRRDHRPSGSHRLEQRYRQSLVEGREHDEVAHGEERTDVVAVSEERDAAFDTEVSSLRFQASAFGPVAREPRSARRAARRRPPAGSGVPSARAGEPARARAAWRESPTMPSRSPAGAVSADQRVKTALCTTSILRSGHASSFVNRRTQACETAK